MKSPWNYDEITMKFNDFSRKTSQTSFFFRMRTFGNSSWFHMGFHHHKLIETRKRCVFFSTELGISWKTRDFALKHGTFPINGDGITSKTRDRHPGRETTWVFGVDCARWCPNIHMTGGYHLVWRNNRHTWRIIGVSNVLHRCSIFIHKHKSMGDLQDPTDGGTYCTTCLAIFGGYIPWNGMASGNLSGSNMSIPLGDGGTIDGLGLKWWGGTTWMAWCSA